MKSKLAIEGGTPVRNKILPYGHQIIDEEDILAVTDALRSDWLTTGPKVTEFENDFARFVNSKYAISVSNGTAALHAALFAAKVQPGTEVITTPFSFVATANAIRYLGGSVKFSDIQPDTYNIDPNKIRKLINEKTKAIVAVDFAGHPANMDEIKDIGKQYNLVVIEDAAHALGATYKNQNVGSLSDMTTFSLHPVKHITTGEGGVITTDNPTLAKQLRLFRNHGIDTDHKQREEKGTWFYDMTDLGFNYRLTDLQSALGISQLKKLPQWLKRRREIAAIYTDNLRKIEGIKLPTTLPCSESSWHLYTIQLDLDCLTVNRDQIFRALRCENIGVNVHYIPIPWHSYYQNLSYHKGDWPIAEKLYERIISLPMWPGMSNDDIKDVISALQKVLTAYKK